MTEKIIMTTRSTVKRDIFMRLTFEETMSREAGVNRKDRILENNHSSVITGVKRVYSMISYEGRR